MATETRSVELTRRPQLGVRARNRISIGFKLVVGLLAALYALVPVAFVISAALNPLNTISGTSLIPGRVTLEHFQSVLTSPTHPWLLWIFNSYAVASISAVIVVVVSALGAYSFSRFRFRGRRLGLISLVIIQLFPNMLAIVALFLLLQAIGSAMPASIAVAGLEVPLPRLGLNSLGGLILIYIGGALGFNTWLMKSYFDTVPYDLDESAMVDGASHFQAFRYVLLPLVRPILAVIGILTFIASYSDFLIARVMLSSPENYTVAVGMQLFITGQFTQRWGAFAAAAIISAIPIVATFLVLQRQLIGGLAHGGVKG